MKIGKKYLLSNGYKNSSWITIIGENVSRDKFYGVSVSGFIYEFNSVGKQIESNRFTEKVSLDLNTANAGDWALKNYGV